MVETESGAVAWAIGNAPFPLSAHRTGQADFPHPALGQDFTPLLSRAPPSAVSEHSSEFIGCPISRSFTTYCVGLELRSLPSTGVTRFRGATNLSTTPKRPAFPRGRPVVIPDRALGLPVFVVFLVNMPPPLPRRSVWVYCFAHSPSRISLPRKGCRAGLRIVRFEDCSAFTHVAACTLARSPILDPLIRRLRHFVTSMAAPDASAGAVAGWAFRPLESAAFPGAHPTDISQHLMLQ